MTDDETDPATGYERVVVADDGYLGVSNDSEGPKIRGLGDHGWGDDLKVPAWNEIRERFDPEELEAGTHVATIYYDLDRWGYRIEWEIGVGLLERLRRRFA